MSTTARKLSTPLKWHGGKHYLAAKIVAMMPPHTRYLEAFAGGLSVLLNKPCDGVAEWANDLNGELTNFWQVLRDNPEPLLRSLNSTPLSQVEFANATSAGGYGVHPIACATAFFIRMRQSRQGLGKDYCTPTVRTRRGMNENVSAWLSAVEGLPAIVERLKRVEIWNRPAVDAIAKLDGPELLVYADPPYLHETRSSTGEYGAFEMSRDDHVALLECLAAMRGLFVLSGYHSPLYDEFAAGRGWRCVQFDLPNNASGARLKQRKTECIWTNFV